jgi:Protein of unknown function, DUF482.
MCKDISNDFSVEWISSVEGIPDIEWDKIVGKTIFKSKAFFKAIEHSEFQSIRYYYLVIYKSSVIIAIIPCFCYEIDLFNLMISSKQEKIITGIRKIYPKLLKIKAFVIGAYPACGDHFIQYDLNISKEDYTVAKNLIDIELKKKCKELDSKFIIVKDIRERHIEKVKQTLNEDFHFFISLPTTSIPIIADIDYPKALRKKNRKRYNKFKAQYDSNFKWEIVSDFSNEVDRFTELYFNVLNKAKNKFEILSCNFFRQINDVYLDKSFLLVAKDNSGKIRLMELVLEDKDYLCPLYMGIKYEDDDTKVLYLNAIFRTVEEAEKRNKDYVDLGQTSCYPKVMSGGLVENIYYGFWTEHLLFKWLIKNIFPKMFRPSQVPCHVYLDKYKNEAYQILEKKGFSLL